MTTHEMEAPAQKVLEHGAAGMTRVYVWDRVVRLCHWGMVLSLTVLSITGFYIGNPFVTVPGEAGGAFVMGWMRAIHFGAAIVFTIAVPSRLLWMVLSGNYFARWHQFIPVTKLRFEQMWGTFKFYMFLQREPPHGMLGHNPLAGGAYFIIYMMELVMILTGLGLYGMFATDSPLHVFEGVLALFGGAQWARWIHHVIMYLLIGFFVHHFYSAVLTAIVEKNGTLESIFSGYKWAKTPKKPEEKK